MELTKEQIQKIETYLDRKNLTYIDIRYEVLDHIINDIENLMTTNNTFIEAYEITIQKWNKHLQGTSTYITGYIYERPKIVIKKAVNVYKFWFVIMMLLSVLTPFVINHTIDFSFIPKKVVFLFLTGVLLSALYQCFMYVKMRQTKVKTTFLFLFEKQVLPALSFGLIIIPNIHLKEAANGIVLLFGTLLMLLTFFGKMLFDKHQKINQRIETV